MKQLGIDIGGSGIKAAIVDTKTGERLTERYRIDTPKPAEPQSMAKVVKKMVDHFEWKSAVGCSFPAVVARGRVYSAGNISPKWIGTQADHLFSEYCNGLKFYVANDADLAGLAEMKMGAGKDISGLVITITVGTGLGSGMFYNGKLIPNMEFGHVFHTNGKVIEKYAADSARKKQNLKIGEWAKRFDFFLHHIARVTSPDMFIIGGGISKKFHKYHDKITVNIPVEAALFRNHAGIIGAALYAADFQSE